MEYLATLMYFFAKGGGSRDERYPTAKGQGWGKVVLNTRKSLPLNNG